MDMMVMSTIGIDKLAWDVVWRINDESDNLSVLVECISPLLKDRMDPAYYEALLYACNNNYDIAHLWDSLSPNQLVSKHWLVDELQKILKDAPVNVQLFGGWFGFPLVDILISKLNPTQIENIDIDEKAILLFKKIRSNKDIDISLIGTCCDVSDENIREWGVDLIINTSSEHMQPLPLILSGREYRSNFCLPLKKSMPKKGPCLIALQSNNMFHIDDHINCVNSEDELVANSGLEDIKYKGSLEMPNGYKRFMVIGYA